MPMKKANFKSGRGLYQRGSGLSAVLSRQDRRLWTGVLSRREGTSRMRCDDCAGFSADSYETQPAESAPAEHPGAGCAVGADVPDRSEVKPRPQTVEETAEVG